MSISVQYNGHFFGEPVKTSLRPNPAKAQRGNGASKMRPESTTSRIVALPAGGTIPDEISSADAKNRISDVVKKAAAGGRTTIMSRGYAIAVIGPVTDIPESARNEATRLPTTEIKSGQTSLKGVIARADFAVLTIHGEGRAAVYRAKAGSQLSATEEKLNRFIALLEATEVVQRRNRDEQRVADQLKALLESIHAEIEASLDLLDRIDRDRTEPLRAQYAALKARAR